MRVTAGVDIVSVPRMRRLLARFGDRLTERLFTPAERRYCSSRPDPALHYAARFAAKEAVRKAVGRTLPWREVEVVRLADGKPVVEVPGVAVSVSLAHDGDYAVAFCIASEGGEEGRGDVR